jgi:hypothetical protein
MYRRRTLSISLGVLFALAVLLCGQPKALAACATLPSDKGSVTTTASVPSTQTYYIWSRNKAPATASNGYYLQIDANCGIDVGDATIPVNTWTWVNYQNGSAANRMTVSLTAGTHSFKFYGLDASTIVDRVLLTADAGCTPSGVGDNCVNSTTSAPPTIISPGPSSTPVSGTLQAGTAGTGNKTTIIVDGKVVAVGDGLVGLDTSKLSDGYHTVTVTTINADGTKQTYTKRILVRNHPSIWQRAYNELYKLLGYNKLLTNMVAFLLVAAMFAAAITTGYYVWTKRVWEKLPYVKKVHLRFLHVPAILKTLHPPKSVAPKTSAVVGTMAIGQFGRKLWMNVRTAVAIAIVSLLGSVAVLYGVAATNSFVVEPEAGSKSGVSVVADAGAAGGAYIQFGTGAVVTPTCPAGQTGTPPNCISPPPAFASQCLARSGTKITVAGPQKHLYSDRLVKANSIYNATTATWDGLDINGNPIPWVTIFEGSGPACWYGGVWNGPWDDTSPTVTWSSPYHHSAAFTVRVPNFLIEGYRANNSGDGINIEKPASGFHVRAVYLSNIHDDCVQNDSLLSGVVEDSLFDGCYAGISEDDYSKTVNGSANTMTFQNNLLYMKPMPTVFKGAKPGTAMVFKGWSQTPSSKMILKNNIFYASQAPGFEVASFGVPAGMVFTECSNNIFVWTGPGSSPPGNWPANCFTINKDISVWNKAVASWKTAHPGIK